MPLRAEDIVKRGHIEKENGARESQLAAVACKFVRASQLENSMLIIIIMIMA